MMDVSIKECDSDGLYECVFRCMLESVKATQWVFSENRGICVVRSVVTEEDGTLVELRGEQTKIHHNGGDGLSAYS